MWLLEPKLRLVFGTNKSSTGTVELDTLEPIPLPQEQDWSGHCTRPSCIAEGLDQPDHRSEAPKEAINFFT